MKGYKAFNSDLTCRGFQYEIGEIYEMDESPIICKRGFHFCTDIANCYKFYDMSEDTRICEIEAIGDIDSKEDEMKYCTNKIRIIKEITDWRRKANINSSSSGYCNSGDYNSGNCNSGYCNSGDFNSGNCNSGYCNSGNFNSGVFNTDKEPTIKMFDKESNWTYYDWCYSDAYDIMRTCPYSYSDFISESNMTTDEKNIHPKYKTIGGYIKTIIVTIEDRQKWWDGLSTSEKETIRALPNFDADKFCKCVGINHI